MSFAITSGRDDRNRPDPTQNNTSTRYRQTIHPHTIFESPTARSGTSGVRDLVFFSLTATRSGQDGTDRVSRMEQFSANCFQTRVESQLSGESVFRPPSTLVRTYTIQKSVLVKSRKGAQFWNKNHNCRCGQEVASEDRYSQFLLKPTRHIGSVFVQDGLHADIRFSK